MSPQTDKCTHPIDGLSYYEVEPVVYWRCVEADEHGIPTGDSSTDSAKAEYSGNVIERFFKCAVCGETWDAVEGKDGLYRPRGWAPSVDQAIYRGLLSDYTWANINPEKATHRYALVEQSRFTRMCWLTEGNSIEELTDYHDSQEHPEDWIPQLICDLTNGDIWRVEKVETTFALET